MKKNNVYLGICILSLVLAGCNSNNNEKAPQDAEKPKTQTSRVAPSTEAQDPIAEEKAAPDEKTSPTPNTDSDKDVTVENTPKIPPVDTPLESTPDSATEAVLTETETIMLKAVTIARGVDKRQPIDPGVSFSISEGTKIYAILDIKNPEKIESELQITFKRPNSDKEIGKVTVSVGAQKKWRTWAFTRHAKTQGSWMVMIRNGEGEILGQVPFEMTL